MKLEDAFNFPENINIDLTRYKEIRIRCGTCVYKIDVEKFLKEFGTLVEIVYDKDIKN